MLEKMYISGKITGNKNYRKDFSRGCMKARDLGYWFINPATLAEEHFFKLQKKNPSWSDYMRYDLRLMLKCDAVIMLRGWEDSQGARLEHDVAQKCGLKIVYEEEA